MDPLLMGLPMLKQEPCSQQCTPPSSPGPCDDVPLNLISQKKFHTHMKMEPQSSCESDIDVGGEEERKPSATCCADCAKMFTNPVQLARHRCKAAYKCLLCKWMGRSSVALRNHSQQHHKDYSQQDHDYDYKTDKDVDISCNDCKGKFMTERGLHIHQTNKHSIKQSNCSKSFVCTLCMASFTKRSYVKNHILKAHTLAHPIKCPECVASFRSQRSLRHHMKVHMAPRPFRCSVCLSSFRQRNELIKHLKVHLGEGATSVKGAKAIAIKKELGEESSHQQLPAPSGGLVVKSVKGHYSDSE